MSREYTKIDRLISDICNRDFKIVLRETDYYLYSDGQKIDIPHKHIQELLEQGFVTKNKYGGLETTEAARTYSESLVERLRKPNPEHPNKMIDYCVLPEKYDGEI